MSVPTQTLGNSLPAEAPPEATAEAPPEATAEAPVNGAASDSGAAVSAQAEPPVAPTLANPFDSLRQAFDSARDAKRSADSDLTVAETLVVEAERTLTQAQTARAAAERELDNRKQDEIAAAIAVRAELDRYISVLQA